jgi:hypothetical protein
MKKALAILALVGVLLFATSGLAFAGPIGQFGWGHTATQFQIVGQFGATSGDVSSESGAAVGIITNGPVLSGPSLAGNAANNSINQLVAQ